MEVSPVTDIQIIRLYWDRDEQAIHETDLRYGSKLHYLAHKIVQDFEDAQECVNDTYLKTWDSLLLLHVDVKNRPQWQQAYIPHGFLLL